jgi:hypothetical protein
VAITKLHLIDGDEPTREMVAIAKIEQNQSEWAGPCGKTDGWKPIETAADSPLPVDEVQRKSYKVIVIDSPIPLWRRILRWRKTR